MRSVPGRTGSWRAQGAATTVRLPTSGRRTRSSGRRTPVRATLAVGDPACDLIGAWTLLSALLPDPASLLAADGRTAIARRGLDELVDDYRRD